jgi:hypothetical protein
VIIIVPVIVIIGAPVGVVGAMGKFVVAIVVRMLDVTAASSALGNNVSVASLDFDALMAI